MDTLEVETFSFPFSNIPDAKFLGFVAGLEDADGHDDGGEDAVVPMK